MNEKVESGLEVVGYVDPSDLARQISMYHVQREKGLCVYEPLTLLSDAERAVQLEMERHRKTWRQLEQVTGLLHEIIGAVRSDRDLGLWQCRMNEADRWEREAAALSQQAEPAPINQCDGCQAGIPADEKGYHRMGKPGGYADLMYCERKRYAAEPAPAQDEREARDWEMKAKGVMNVIHLVVSKSDQDVLRRYANDMLDEARHLATRPAQTEQQPEQEPFWYAVVSEQAPSINSAIRRLDVAQEFADSKRERWPDTRVVPLYAAPIAQTEQQPEQSNMLELAKQQITGFVCGLKYDANELIHSMGLSLEEWQQIKSECDWIPQSVVAEFDATLSATPTPAMDAKEE